VGRSDGPGAEVLLWDVEQKKSRQTISLGKGGRPRCRFSPDGKLLAVEIGGNVQLYEHATQKARRFLPYLSLGAVVFSPDGKRLAVSSPAPLLLDASNDNLRTTLPAGSLPLGFSPDGALLAVKAGPSRIDLRETGTGRRVAELSCGAVQVRAAAFSPDGKTLSVAGADGVVLVWSRRPSGWSDRLDGLQPAPASLAALDNDVLAVAVEKGVSLWRPSSGIVEAVLPDAPSPVVALASAPGSRWLAACCSNGDAVVWDVKQRAGPRKLPTTAVRSLAFSRTGRLATGHEGGSIRFWVAPHDRGAISGFLWERGTVKGHEKAILALTFSAGGGLVSAGADGAVKLWDASGKEQGALPVQAGAVAAVALSPDGKTLATAGAKLPVRLWSLADRARRKELPPSAKASVATLAFAPDGKTLVTGGSSGALAFWETVTGEQLMDFEDGKKAVTALVFAPGGERLAVADSDGAVRLWSAPR
jgi:WD40 repeat protein